ncbi:VENN motif pre-toxin domain-containing protein [Neisseria weixii]|uniref:VENN motif pre-toxin domain-containing protein n=2 Tax=Neisseria weixii TaxID=1853276 RepID=UPI00361B34F5
MQREIALQRNVSQDFGRNVQEAKTEVNQQIDRLKAQKEAGKISEADYHDKVQKLQYLNVGISSVAGALAAPTESGLGISAAALNPAGAYAIGQYFKGLVDENGRLGGDKETARVLAHGILAAAAAKASDGNALTAAISSGGVEAVIPYVSEWLYGTRDTEKLSAEQKTVLGNIAQLAGTGVGLASGGGAEAFSDGLRARNAVENNFSMQDLGISQNAQSGLQQIAHRQAQQFVVNANSSAAEKSKLFELLKAYKANAAITAEITAALGFGANVSITINQDKSVTITAAGTAEYGVEGFVGVSASNKSRLDGFFSEVCSSGGGAVVVGVCAGANLERNQPLIVTGKVGTGAGAFAGANVGYQWTVNLPESKDDHK